MVKITCRCGQMLGESVAGQTVIRHRGREWVGIATSIRCDRCGQVWRPAASAAASPEPTTVLT